MNHEKAAFLPDEIQAKNMQIEKTYFKILKEIAKLSTSFENSNLRVRIEIDLTYYPGKENEIFELLTSYVFLLLSRNDEGHLRIGYAIHESAARYLGQTDYNKLVRIIYSQTIPSKTGNEDCLTVFPYYDDIYEEARYFVRDHEEEDPYYKFIQEEFKGQ